MTQAEFNQFIESTCSATIVDPDRPLVDQGIDSLGMLTLMVAIEDSLGIELDPESPVSYTHLTLPTTLHECRSRWSPYH